VTTPNAAAGWRQPSSQVAVEGDGGDVVIRRPDGELHEDLPIGGQAISIRSAANCLERSALGRRVAFTATASAVIGTTTRRNGEWHRITGCLAEGGSSSTPENRPYAERRPAILILGASGRAHPVAISI
jgi:hypothetical protein